jgi:hypothetical protein
VLALAVFLLVFALTRDPRPGLRPVQLIPTSKAIPVQ